MVEMILVGSFTLAAAGLGSWLGATLSLRAAQRSFAASEQAAQARAEEAEQRTVGGVFALLRMEMDYNLELVTQLYRDVTTDLEGGRDEQAFLQRARFLSEPWPAWQRLMWETQAVNLPLMLDTDAVRQAYDLYSALDTLTQLRAALLAKLPPHVIADFTTWKEESTSGKALPFEQMLFRPTVLHFNVETASLWQRAYAIMSELARDRVGARPAPPSAPARTAPAARPTKRTLGQIATVHAR